MKTQHLFTRPMTALLTCTCLILAAGCGKDRDSAKPGPAPQGETPPDFQLSGPALEKLDQWSASTRKVCNAASIFGTPEERAITQSAEAGIDAWWLYDTLGGRLEIATEAGFARLSPQGSMAGESSYQTRSLIDGIERSFAASTKTDGVNCEVLVENRVVRTAVIYDAVTIEESWRPTKVVTPPAAYVERPRHDHALTDLGIIDRFIGNWLQPDADDVAWITKTLGLPGEHRKVRASARQTSRDDQPFYTFPDVPTLPPALPNPALTDPFGVIGTVGEIAALRPCDAAYQRRFIRAVPARTFAGTLPDGKPQPKGVAQIEFALTFTQAERPIDHKLSLAWVKSLSAREISADEAYACAEDRLIRHLQGTPRSLRAGVSYPNPESVTSACQRMFPAFEKEMTSNPSGLKFLRSVFTGTVGVQNRPMLYGWDTLLFAVGTHALKRGGSLSEQLDPEGVIPVVQAADAFVSGIRAYTAENPAPAFFDGTEQQLALNWALGGFSLDEIQLTSWLSAAASLADPFAEAARQLLEDAGRDPITTETDRIYAASIGEDFKDVARKVIAKSESIPATKPTIKKRASEVIKKKTGMTQWQGYLAALDQIESFVASETALMGEDHSERFSFNNLIGSWIERAIDQSWTSAQFGVLVSVAKLARRDMMCERKKATVTAIDCWNGRMASAEDRGLLKPEYGDRYGSLASDFMAALDRLSDATHFSTRRSIMDAFEQPVWSRCNADSFAVKKGQFNAVTVRLAGADFRSRMTIERELDDVLEDCD